jgi:hypothetical protein
MPSFCAYTKRLLQSLPADDCATTLVPYTRDTCSLLRTIPAHPDSPHFPNTLYHWIVCQATDPEAPTYSQGECKSRGWAGGGCAGGSRDACGHCPPPDATACARHHPQLACRPARLPPHLPTIPAGMRRLGALLHLGRGGLDRTLEALDCLMLSVQGVATPAVGQNATDAQNSWAKTMTVGVQAAGALTGTARFACAVLDGEVDTLPQQLTATQTAAAAHLLRE